MYELGPESQKALDDFCKDLSDSQADYLRGVVRQVCQDPSGRREPTHTYTRKFHNPRGYAKKLPKNLKVWELKTNRYRALFALGEVRVDDTTEQRLEFVPLGGQRLFYAEDAPWPH